MNKQSIFIEVVESVPADMIAPVDDKNTLPADIRDPLREDTARKSCSYD
jgi:hypothetical protein